MTAQPKTSVHRSTQPVVAAVHLDSRYFDRVIAQAVQRCRQTESELVVFSVITRSSIGHALNRIHQRLARCPVPVNLVVTRVKPDDVTSSEQAAAIGKNLVIAVSRLRAHTLVIGHPPAGGDLTSGVGRTVAAELPADVELIFGTPGLAMPTDVSGLAQAGHDRAALIPISRLVSSTL